MSKRKVKILSALAAAGLAGVSGLASSARAGVTLTQGYVSGQISSTSTFTAGTTTAVTLTAAGPNVVNLLPGQFFRFGVTEVVTGDTNPVSGDAWDLDQVNNVGNNDPQPAQLGLLGIAMQVPSTDTTGSKLAPLASSGTSKASVASKTTMGWAVSSTGDVNGGLVGDSSQISGGATAIADATNLGVQTGVATGPDAPLTDFNSQGPDPSFFTGLAYSAVGTGSVTLSPAIFSNGTQYWVATNLGTVGGAGAAYGGQFFGSNDTIKPLAAITVNIAAVPEPASLGLLSVGGLALLARRSRKSRA